MSEKHHLFYMRIKNGLLSPLTAVYKEVDIFY